MKRLFTALLALGIVLSLAACQNTSVSDSPSSDRESTQDNTTVENSTSEDDSEVTTEESSSESAEGLTETSTEESTAPAELDLSTIIYDTWCEPGGQIITFREDGTCDYNGSAYTWTTEPYTGDLYSNSDLFGKLYQGETEAYDLMVITNSTYGYPIVCIRPANSGGSYTFLFSKNYFDVITVTLDNWKDYFELDFSESSPRLQTDSNGAITDFSWAGYLVLKEEYDTAPEANSVAFSYTLDYIYRQVSLNTETGEIVIGDASDAYDTTNVDCDHTNARLELSSAYHRQRICHYIAYFARVYFAEAMDAGYVPVLNDINIYDVQGELWIVK